MYVCVYRTRYVPCIDNRISVKRRDKRDEDILQFQPPDVLHISSWKTFSIST